MSKANSEFMVSVIIPVYNAEPYIDECINSLMNQTIGFSNLEVIMIDDGSSDDSLIKCQDYSEKYNNIILISQKNSGVSSARNKGIKKSTGKYIMMLDSDDYLSSNTIKDLVDFFEDNYEKIDLVCYPLIIDNGIKKTMEVRYKLYDKGTDIYDLEEYFYVYQKTVNVIIKNNGNKNILYDENMSLSEDQDFNTKILMTKKKIGFVSTGKYYYRKLGTGVSSTKNNPYYCFEDITKYNEYILKKYKSNNIIPKYIQNLVITTYCWRLNSDQIYPYFYEKEEYRKAINRIYNIFKQIDTDVIAKLDTNIYNKIYFLESSNRKIKYNISDDEISITCDNIQIYKNNCIFSNVYKFKIDNNKIKLSSTMMTYFFNFKNFDLFLIETDKNNNNKYININKYLIKSNKQKSMCDDVKGYTYNLNIELALNKEKKYKFVCRVKDKEIPIKFEFNKFTNNIIYSNNTVVKYTNNDTYFSISKKSKFTKIFNIIKRDAFYFKKNKRAFAYRIFNHFYPVKKHTFIYADRNNIIDNAYYQFKNDFKKKDNIKRYYISSIDKKSPLFTKSERNYIIKPYSIKHKMLFLKCEKIFTSFIDLQIYCPFNNGIRYYKDMKRYDLIYLQHGLLHANLVYMYSREFTEIDKFIISSNFEKNNLINNYNYNSEDLVESLMPRMGLKSIENEAQNKILYAPSWRAYLIGKSIKGERAINNSLFINSNYFKEVNSWLESKKLNEMLEKNDLVLHLKLHPIMKDYDNNYYTNNRIKLVYEDVKLSEYKVFITDFSSYQFDYIKYYRPIFYFVPDYKEFISGLHSYRKLDLKYEDAFGELCKNKDELLKNLNSVIKNNYIISDKYKQKMANFFFKNDNPCETIYKKIEKK